MFSRVGNHLVHRPWMSAGSRNRLPSSSLMVCEMKTLFPPRPVPCTCRSRLGPLRGASFRVGSQIARRTDPWPWFSVDRAFASIFPAAFNFLPSMRSSCALRCSVRASFLRCHATMPLGAPVTFPHWHTSHWTISCPWHGEPTFFMVLLLC